MLVSNWPISGKFNNRLTQAKLDRDGKVMLGYNASTESIEPHLLFALDMVISGATHRQYRYVLGQKTHRGAYGRIYLLNLVNDDDCEHDIPGQLCVKIPNRDFDLNADIEVYQQIGKDLCSGLIIPAEPLWLNCHGQDDMIRVPVLVMPKMDGNLEDLRLKLTEKPILEQYLVIFNLLVQLCYVLDWLTKYNYFYTDLKCKNVLFHQENSQPRFYLADLGSCARHNYKEGMATMPYPYRNTTFFKPHMADLIYGCWIIFLEWHSTRAISENYRNLCYDRTRYVNPNTVLDLCSNLTQTIHQANIRDDPLNGLTLNVYVDAFYSFVSQQGNLLNYPDPRQLWRRFRQFIFTSYTDISDIVAADRQIELPGQVAQEYDVGSTESGGGDFIL